MTEISSPPIAASLFGSHAAPISEEAPSTAAASVRRPITFQERLARRLFLALSPRLKWAPPGDPPPEREPFERFAIDRCHGRGHLAAIWYPALAHRSQGAVLLLHPWTRWGQAYFDRCQRINALRRAGYQVMTFDLGNIGGSGPAPSGFFDLDVEDALLAFAERAAGHPMHIWGLSCGGYWAHPVLSRMEGVSGAVFEDVSPHLIEWSHRLAPLGRPFYLVFQHFFRDAYRFLDMRQHAPALRVSAAAYISGELDAGVRPHETRELARLAGADCLIVPEATHLAAIKLAEKDVLELAFATFSRALAGRRPAA